MIENPELGNWVKCTVKTLLELGPKRLTASVWIASGRP
jgi:hypothetical protein